MRPEIKTLPSRGYPLH